MPNVFDAYNVKTINKGVGAGKCRAKRPKEHWTKRAKLTPNHKTIIKNIMEKHGFDVVIALIKAGKTGINGTIFMNWLYDCDPNEEAGPASNAESDDMNTEQDEAGPASDAESEDLLPPLPDEPEEGKRPARTVRQPNRLDL